MPECLWTKHDYPMLVFNLDSVEIVWSTKRSTQGSSEYGLLPLMTGEFTHYGKGFPAGKLGKLIGVTSRTPFVLVGRISQRSNIAALASWRVALNPFHYLAHELADALDDPQTLKLKRLAIDGNEQAEWCLKIVDINRMRVAAGKTTPRPPRPKTIEARNEGW